MSADADVQAPEEAARGLRGFKEHCSFFPVSLEAMATHAKDLKPYRWPLSDACDSRVLPVTEGAR